jgi:hypothetical protein
MGESDDDGVAAAERQVNIYEDLLRDLKPVRGCLLYRSAVWLCGYRSGCVAIALAVFLSLWLCGYRSGCVSIPPAVWPSLWLSGYRSGGVSIALAVWLSLWLSGYRSGCLLYGLRG